MPSGVRYVLQIREFENNKEKKKPSFNNLVFSCKKFFKNKKRLGAMESMFMATFHSIVPKRFFKTTGSLHTGCDFAVQIRLHKLISLHHFPRHVFYGASNRSEFFSH